MTERALAAILALGTLGCGGKPAAPPATDSAAAKPAAWQDQSPHQARSLVANGVRLEVLDWGGTGSPLVLIHGLGDSPHIFDDIAPLLTDDFRVIAYGRRGHAGSEKKGPYDNATLTEDLKQLLDSLHLDRVSLLGWSMGGNEITEFASRYPARAAGLVYLDAGYDWSDPLLVRAFETIPTPITPSPTDQHSLDALRSWFRRTWVPDLPWPPSWEAHMRDLVDVQPDGSTRYRQTDSVNALMFESLVAYRKDFRKVKAPALALWAPHFLPEPKADTAASRKVADWERDYFAAYRAKSIRRFKAEVAQAADSVLPNTSHASIGAVDVPGLAGIIRQFLRPKAKPPA
jgi:pimeloyl-ACP methyl ester carboxylesterase